MTALSNMVLSVDLHGKVNKIKNPGLIKGAFTTFSLLQT